MQRIRAFFTHAAVSLIIAIVVAVVVLQIWYPYPYDQLSGGRELFILLTSVDIIMGPLLTLAIFKSSKPRRELILDISIIAALQILALGYGIHTAFLARPVAAVFEVNLVRIVAASQVAKNELSRSHYIKRLPLSGPKTLATRRPTNSELLDSVYQALNGHDIGQRPSYWIPWNNVLALRAAKSVALLLKFHPEARSDIEARLQKMGVTVETSHYLTVIARARGWVAILNSEGAIVGFLPYGD
jgi:hypothetical protein